MAAGQSKAHSTGGRRWTATVYWLLWCSLWVSANFVGFGLAYGIGRAMALAVGGDVGGDVGDSGILDVSAYGNAPAGAVVFVAAFAAAACLMQWLVLLGVLSNRPELSWTLRWPLIGIVLLITPAIVFRFVPGQEYLGIHVGGMLVLLALAVGVFWRSVRERLATLQHVDSRSRVTWAGWFVFAATIGVGIYTAVAVRPWLGNGRCFGCGAVPAAGIGMQFGAITVPIVLLSAFNSGAFKRPGRPQSSGSAEQPGTWLT